MRVAWSETLRALKVGEVIETVLIDRINVVRHISRISKLEDKKFTTRKTGKNRLEIERIQ